MAEDTAAMVGEARRYAQRLQFERTDGRRGGSRGIFYGGGLVRLD